MSEEPLAVQALSRVNADLAAKLVTRYLEMRTLEAMGRWEDCLEEAGKFAEEVYRFVYLAATGILLHEIENMDDLRKRL